MFKQRVFPSYLRPAFAAILLTACEIQPADLVDANDDLSTKDSSVHAMHTKNLGDGCFRERFVQPPRGHGKDKKRPVPRYLLEGPWAQWIDAESIALKLNERDIDFSMDAGGTELHFTNPGKSRAVIDISYCLVVIPPDAPPEEDVDDGSGTVDDGSGTVDTGGDNGSGDGSGDDGGGAVVVDDPACTALTCEGVGI